MMLAAKLELHDISDIEAFCREALNNHLAVGKRRADGSYTGPSHLSPDDYDDLLLDLFEIACVEAKQFHTTDDGRGTNRFSGYLLWIIHRRIIDWKRKRWGSTRYGPRPVVELTADERDLVAQHVDFTGPEVLDLVNAVELSPEARRTLKVIVIPLVLEQHTIEDYSRRSGIPLNAVHFRISRLRRELEQTRLLAA